jgi:hypothetical protein
MLVRSAREIAAVAGRIRTVRIMSEVETLTEAGVPAA